MGFYNRWILPQVIEVAMRQKNFVPFRERTAGAAHGRDLEIGIGSGLNLASFHPDIESVCGVDPSAELLAKASQRVANVGFPVRLLEASSEKLPLEDRSFDTVVMTFTWCSIVSSGSDSSAHASDAKRIAKFLTVSFHRARVHRCYRL